MLLRFGLLASATMLVLGHLGLLYPVTQFSGAWYAGGAPVLMSTVVLVAGYWAWTCARRAAPDAA
jgi:protein-S-isoprenylcysteine O-methyltransferase Ste14